MIWIRIWKKIYPSNQHKMYADPKHCLYTAQLTFLGFHHPAVEGKLAPNLVQDLVVPHWPARRVLELSRYATAV